MKSVRYFLSCVADLPPTKLEVVLPSIENCAGLPLWLNLKVGKARKLEVMLFRGPVGTELKKLCSAVLNFGSTVQKFTPGIVEAISLNRIFIILHGIHPVTAYIVTIGLSDLYSLLNCSIEVISITCPFTAEKSLGAHTRALIASIRSVLLIIILHGFRCFSYYPQYITTERK